MTLRSLSSSTRNYTQAALAACLLMATVALPTSVYAADTDSRLRQLEGSVDTLNRAVFKGETPPTPLAAPSSAPTTDYQASVETRLNDLESQLRDLIGRIEKQEYDTTQLKGNVDKTLADFNLRLNDMQSGTSGAIGGTMRQTGTLAPNDMGGSVAPTGTPTAPLTAAAPDGLPEPGPVMNPPTAPPVDPANPNAPASQNSPTVQTLGSVPVGAGGAAVPPTQSGDAATTQYETAFSMLKSGNYANAKTGFESFMKNNPDHPLASNATYWLGESYYAGGDYEKAARIFAESYKKYPKGPKVADSLLKMGMSLAASGKKKEGCVALKQLKKEFASGGNTVTVRRADQEIARLGCS